MMKRQSHRDWYRCALAALCGGLMSAGGAAGQTLSPYDILPADLNFNGELDVDDLNLILHYIGTPPPYPSWQTGDINRDGEVNINDYFDALSWIGYTRPELPVIPNVDIKTNLITHSGKQYLRIWDEYPSTNVDISWFNGSYAVWDYDQYRLPRVLDLCPSMSICDFEIFNPGDDPSLHRVAPIDHANASISIENVRQDGFDIRVNVCNPDESEKPKIRAPGAISIAALIGGITEWTRDDPPTNAYHLVSYGGARDFGGNFFSTLRDTGHVERHYPVDSYSPTIVLQGKDYTIGASVHYPILNYRHGVEVRTGVRPNLVDSSASLNYPERFIMFGLNSDNALYNNPALPTYDGMLLPNECREYVVSVRFMRTEDVLAESQGEGWMRTLTPYRRYFQHSFGLPQYSRNANPVLATLTSQGNASATNHRAWWPTNRTPGCLPAECDYSWGDDAWANWIDYWETYSTFDRVMAWNPTGQSRYFNGTTWESTTNNFPFQFTSEWDVLETESGTPIRSLTETQLGAFASTITDFGLWWGNSDTYASTFIAHTKEPLDPANNSTHRTAALFELQGATDASANMIGLDSFGDSMRQWNAYYWLLDMRDAAPGTKFIGELAMPDFIHTLAGNWFDTSTGHTGSLGTILKPQHPHFIIDFLLPGHETWGPLPGAHVDQAIPGRWPTESEIQSVLADLAELGFIPVYYPFEFVIGVGTDQEAAETWLDTVPSNLVP